MSGSLPNGFTHYSPVELNGRITLAIAGLRARLGIFRPARALLWRRSLKELKVAEAQGQQQIDDYVQPSKSVGDALELPNN